jgi:predicted 3-demethylubiquinone-9 3-methyltransferase (glyoxalase superfamily)
MAERARPFLMFTGEAEAAMGAYTRLFADGEVLELTRWGPGGAGPEGQVQRGAFRVAGQTFLCFDSPPVHGCSFPPSFSIFVDCVDAAEVERLYAALVEGGAALMPLGEYGFSRRFGWVNDRFGVSWQLNLA